MKFNHLNFKAMKKTIVMMAALMLTAGGMVYAQQPEKQDTPQKENPTAPEQKQEPTAPEEKPDPVKPEQTPAVSQFAEIEEPPLVEKTDIDRSWLEGKIYGIEDTAGVSDEVKQKFVEFILTSDWFWDTCVDVPYQTEWFFENGAYGITLLVKVWNTDMQIDGDNWCDFEVSTLFLSGDKVMDGLRSSPVEIGTDLSTL